MNDFVLKIGLYLFYSKNEKINLYIRSKSKHVFLLKISSIYDVKKIDLCM